MEEMRMPLNDRQARFVAVIRAGQGPFRDDTLEGIRR
jgi:hypothetical protein